MFTRPFCIGLLALALLGASSTASAGAGGRQVHVVYQGQRLGSIAKRYNVSIEAICQANGITRRDPIRPGQRLSIPSRAEARAMDEAPDSAKAEAGPSIASPKPAAVQAAVEPTASAKATKVATSEPAPLVKAASSSKPASPAASPKISAAGLAATAVDPTTIGISPVGVSHRVKSGESLSSIAVRYDTTVKALLQANKLSRDKVIRVGQVLVIPRVAGNGTWWGKFARAPKRPGEIEVFAHHAHSIRWKGKVVVGGKVQSAARAGLSRMLGATGSAPPVPERLLLLLTHVSDTFGGRPIRLVSGYRTSSYVKDSRHRHSSAVDFSIEGVPNSAVRDYMLQLSNVGVGYYPNSTFVHLDVRGRTTYWVDYAGPGEAPRKTPRADVRLASNSRLGKRKSTAVTRYRRVTGSRATRLEVVDQGLVDRALRGHDVRPSAAQPAVALGASLPATTNASASNDVETPRGASAARSSAAPDDEPTETRERPDAVDVIPPGPKVADDEPSTSSTDT